MDEIVKEIGTKNNCTFCGVFRRQALDRGATMMKVRLTVHLLLTLKVCRQKRYVSAPTCACHVHDLIAWQQECTQQTEYSGDSEQSGD